MATDIRSNTDWINLASQRSSVQQELNTLTSAGSNDDSENFKANNEFYTKSRVLQAKLEDLNSQITSLESNLRQEDDTTEKSNKRANA